MIFGGTSHQSKCWTAFLHPVLFWDADLAEGMKGIKALAPNNPDIAVAMDSNKQLVDNYIKVTLFALQASLTLLMSVFFCTRNPDLLHCIHQFVTCIFSVAALTQLHCQNVGYNAVLVIYIYAFHVCLTTESILL